MAKPDLLRFVARARVLAVARGGESGIRTRGTLAGTPDFESGTFGHSVTSPPATMAKRNEAVKPTCNFADTRVSPRDASGSKAPLPRYRANLLLAVHR
jgi:hypothetical protein